MFKIYIIYAHPNHTGHHGFFLKTILEILHRNDHPYELLDLYAINYDPVLKVDEILNPKDRTVSPENLDFQKKITECQRFLFIYPTWWGSMPAILKGWFDRVFINRFGFAYNKLGMPVGKLKGKKAAVFTASGSPRLYSLLTRERALKSVTHDILRFCGLKTRGFRLGSARNKNGDGEKEMTAAAEKVYRYLAS